MDVPQSAHPISRDTPPHDVGEGPPLGPPGPSSQDVSPPHATTGASLAALPTRPTSLGEGAFRRGPNRSTVLLGDGERPLHSLAPRGGRGRGRSVARAGVSGVNRVGGGVNLKRARSSEPSGSEELGGVGTSSDDGGGGDLDDVKDAGPPQSRPLERAVQQPSLFPSSDPASARLEKAVLGGLSWCSCCQVGELRV